VSGLPFAIRDVQRRTCATGICQRICKAHVFDETFGINRAFNAEVFVAAHEIAMEFDLFGESGVVIGIRAAGSAKGNSRFDSALENRIEDLPAGTAEEYRKRDQEGSGWAFLCHQLSLAQDR
jgi:hypothetical protein